MRVDPKVELETLVMTIPSAQKNIDIMGKVNAKKQSTLDSFFGLKVKPVVQPAALFTNSSTKTASGSGAFMNKNSTSGGFMNKNRGRRGQYGDSEPKERTCPFYKVSCRTLSCFKFLWNDADSHQELVVEITLFS